MDSSKLCAVVCPVEHNVIIQVISSVCSFVLFLTGILITYTELPLARNNTKWEGKYFLRFLNKDLKNALSHVWTQG